ncbi:PmbA protein [Rhodoblastus sphagnicola]|nr:TldD/PmbA family protein [Rhodoblastus sphagnicola]MBB4198109.1 PmbA protein [Rhodoblastus sphagnicola]
MSAPLDLAEQAVALARKAGADEAQATAARSAYFEIDYSSRRASLARSVDSLRIDLTVFRDGKRGAASITGGRDEDLAEAVAGALIAAQAGVPDDANGVAEGVEAVATRHGPERPDRAAMAAAMTDFGAALARDYPKIMTDGVISAFNDTETGFANSRGLRQHSRRGAYAFGLMFSARDGGRSTSFNHTGWQSFAPRADLLAAETLRRLLDEAVRSLHSKPAPEKFLGDVIFTPDSADTVIGPLAGALSGHALFAGTSPFKDRQGELIASPCFSLLNRPRAFAGGADFDAYGVPTRDLDVIKDGVLDDFLVDFFMARKLGRAQTAGAQNFVVPAGDTPLAEIVGGVKRGVLLSRFSGGVPNSALDFAGVAKNSFYIEDGEIRHALSETMVSGNLRALLRQVYAVSRETVDFGHCRYPYIATTGALISPAP